MKTNFKKLAILAGTTAAMAAGSMSAHAVITAVPAPAQLIPLFYYNNYLASNAVATTVRVTVPKSVGADTVINLLGAPIASSTTWNSTFAGVTTTSKIHYYVMNANSKEVYDGSKSVTPDGETYFEADDSTFRSVMNAGQPYYLILTNDSAVLGGTPTFQFAAEAWIEFDGATAGGAGLPATTSIPVLPLADTADTTTYPTPTNNVIENFTYAQGGPVAAPIHSGIRTSSTTSGLLYRVVDVPVFDPTTHNNTLVAWASSNASGTPAGGNGLSGKLYSVDGSEVQQSLGVFSFPNQLNIVKITGTTPFANSLGITDGYSQSITSGTAGTTGCSAAAVAAVTCTASASGFMKLVIDAVALPAASSTLAPGAYSAVILFNVPTGLSSGDEDASAVAIDTGFFTN